MPYFSWRIPLKDIRRYPPHRADLTVLEQLSFVKDSDVERKYIGLLLRNGCRPLTAADVELVRSQVG